MTPAQRLAAANHRRTAPNQGTPPMTETEARAQAEQLLTALASDDEDRGRDAALQLLTGIAINVARIADALAKPES